MRGRQIKQTIDQGYQKPSTFKNIGEYKVDKKLSGRRAQVYYNKKENKYIVNHKGTQGPKDILTDALYITTGYKTNRFAHAKKVQKQAEMKYKGAEGTSIGHSLGKELALHASHKDAKIIGYNGLTLPSHLLRERKYTNYTHIRNQHDVASFAQLLTGPRASTVNILNAFPTHFLHNHTTVALEKVGEQEF